MNKPLISIIIPTFNAEKYIRETVESVWNSTYPEKELIVIDDGSTDNTPEILQRLKLQDSSLRILVRENRGVAVTRNEGAAMAHGKYLMFLDCDDLIEKEYIALAVNKMEENPGLMLVYGEAVFTGDKSGLWRLPAYKLRRLAYRNLIYISAIIKKSDFLRSGGFCEKIPGREDWDFWISMLKNGGKVYWIPQICFRYRIRKESKRISDRQWKKSSLRILNERHPEFFKQYLGGKLRYYRQLSRIINFFYRK